MDLLSIQEAGLNNPIPDTPTAQPNLTPEVSPVPNMMPTSMTGDRLKALLQVHKTAPFCKWISK